MKIKKRRITKQLRTTRKQGNKHSEYEKLELLDKMIDNQLKITYLKSVLSLPDFIEKVWNLIQDFL